MQESADVDCPPELVASRAGQLYRQARAVLGDRFVDGQVEPDRGVRVRVLDLTDDDTAQLMEFASGLGLTNRARFERAVAADLPRAVRLRLDVIRLLAERPGVLTVHPPLDGRLRRPPLRIELASGADDVAAELHGRFGDYLDVRLDNLPFPAGRVPNPTVKSGSPALERETVDPTELHVELDGSLAVSSGSHVRHAVLITNRGSETIELLTNGNLTAVICDPHTGSALGGYMNPQHLVGVAHTLEPACAARIPLLVGTDSFDLDRGYFIGAGDYELIAPMNFADGRRLKSPSLSFTVTEGDSDPTSPHYDAA